MAVKKTFTLEELIRNAHCTRGAYAPDQCITHGHARWPYDERACNSILQVLGCTPRAYLGDGRARGKPILPAR